ncbi:MAG: hypothetical protein ACI9HY_001633 [Planctomycetaceae bacterium]|jgi:hypothetical protein
MVMSCQRAAAGIACWKTIRQVWITALKVWSKRPIWKPTTVRREQVGFFYRWANYCGNAPDILVDLGQVIWLSAIYDVDMSTYAYDPGYITDFKVIAKSIMDTHDPVCDAP